jgi:hypothetical protein
MKKKSRSGYQSGESSLRNSFAGVIEPVVCSCVVHRSHFNAFPASAIERIDIPRTFPCGFLVLAVSRADRAVRASRISDLVEFSTISQSIWEIIDTGRLSILMYPNYFPYIRVALSVLNNSLQIYQNRGLFFSFIHIAREKERNLRNRKICMFKTISSVRKICNRIKKFDYT